MRRQRGAVAIGQLRVFVQGHVVQALEDGVELLFHITKVHSPAHHGVQLGLEVQTQRVGVAVDAGEQLAGGGALELHGGVDGELFPDAEASAVVVGAAGAGFVHRDPAERGQ